MTSANSAQGAWTAALSRVQSGWGADYFEKHSSRVRDDFNTILKYFAGYEPGFEVNDVRAKRPASLPTESFIELQSTIFDTFSNEGSSG